VNERRTPGEDERNRAVDDAWRAQFREEPSAAVDEAIRAAARREAEVRAARRVSRQPRPGWMRWTPVAAAAGVAVLAFGLLRWLPDQGLRQPSPVAFPTIPQARPDDGAPSHAERRDMSDESLSSHAERRDVSPSSARREPEATAQGAFKSPVDRSVPQSPGRSSSKSSVGAANESTDNAAGASGRREAAPPAEVQADTTAGSLEAIAPPAMSPAPSAQSAQSTPPAQSAPPAPDSAPASGVRDYGAIAATSVRQPAQQKAIDDEWVRRITELYDAERVDDAADALRQFRKVDPRADQRLPEPLRGWAATVRD
jgi:hypothetical protein